MPAYNIPISTSKIIDLIETIKREKDIYKKKDIAREIGIPRATMAVILKVGTAGPSSLYFLERAYEKFISPKMPEGYFSK